MPSWGAPKFAPPDRFFLKKIFLKNFFEKFQMPFDWVFVGTYFCKKFFESVHWFRSYSHFSEKSQNSPPPNSPPLGFWSWRVHFKKIFLPKCSPKNSKMIGKKNFQKTFLQKIFSAKIIWGGEFWYHHFLVFESFIIFICLKIMFNKRFFKFTHWN